MQHFRDGKSLLLTVLIMAGMLVSACMGNHASEKESMLLGKWKFSEVQSESMSMDAQKAAAEKNHISKGLQYIFNKDGSLVIQQDENQMTRKYRVLGKSNILVMEYGSTGESYHIEKLNEKELVLKDAHGTTVSFNK